MQALARDKGTVLTCGNVRRRHPEPRYPPGKRAPFSRFMHATKHVHQIMDTCSNLVVVPLPPAESITTRLGCVVSFVGERSIPFSKKDVPCRINSFNIVTNGSVVQNSNTRVTLPMVDSYFHMGHKIVSILVWTAHNSNASKILYLDNDALRSETKRSLQLKFDDISLRENVLVGDIMNCLTPANQVCCCNNRFYSGHHDLNSVFEYSRAVMWGGAGVGFNRFTLNQMLKFRPNVFYSSDQTLSSWAVSSGVPFRQCNWSFTASKWCSSGDLDVRAINETHWMCPKSRRIWIATDLNASTCKALPYHDVLTSARQIAQLTNPGSRSPR